MTKVTNLGTCVFIIGLVCLITQSVYAKPTLGLLGGLVGALVNNGETYRKCPGILPDNIVDCVPKYMYRTPCVGRTTKGKPVPPCIGNSDPDGNEQQHGSNTNTNTNTVTNNIIIRVRDEDRVEIEKSEAKSNKS